MYRYGETKTIYECSGIKTVLRFNEVTDDSRCPTGVNCVWAGTAHITITLNNNGEIIPIGLDKAARLNLASKSYQVKLEELSPYPQPNKTIDPKDYLATIFFKRD